MSKLKSFLEDWLDEYGHSQGFSIGHMPELSELDNIKLNKMDAQEYWESKTKKRSNNG